MTDVRIWQLIEEFWGVESPEKVLERVLEIDPSMTRDQLRARSVYWRAKHGLNGRYKKVRDVKFKDWSTLEVDYLRDNYQSKSVAEISRILGKSKNAIYAKLRRIKNCGE
jgi:hypothetical protein